MPSQEAYLGRKEQNVRTGKENVKGSQGGKKKIDFQTEVRKERGSSGNLGSAL